MTLTAAAVRVLMNDCLFRQDEDVGNAVTVEGVVNNFGFNPVRLEKHKAEIAELLAELPTQFQPEPEGGGGWSFLNACVDQHGDQWGEHRDIECLMCLGVATKQAQIMDIPKEVLPGGMPYFRVLIP